MTNRIQQLMQFTIEDPKDPFNKYALALEYQKIDAGKALEIFAQLLRDHDNYVPTYYQLGKMYQEAGRNEEALQVFARGIAEARNQNDLKACHELQSALEELQSD